MARLSGKTAIVTGAAQGIGAVYARALAGEGAKVCLSDILDKTPAVEEILKAGGDGITVNTIAPGFTMSDQIEAQRDDLEFYVNLSLNSRAVKRDQVPDDLLGALIFLASPESDFVTGQAIVVDGGMIMH